MHTITGQDNAKYYDPDDEEEVVQEISVNKSTSVTMEDTEDTSNCGNSIEQFLNNLS